MGTVTQDFTKIDEQLKFNMARLGTVNDYKKQIPTPSAMGSSSDEYIPDFVGDVEIVGKYLNYLLTGPALGDRYELEAGWCKDGTSRKMIVDNVPSGAVHIPGIPAYTLGNTNLRGLLPGLLEDIWQIEPQNLLQYMKGKGQIYQECSGEGFQNRNVKNNFFNKIICFVIIILYFIFLN